VKGAVRAAQKKAAPRQRWSVKALRAARIYARYAEAKALQRRQKCHGTISGYARYATNRVAREGMYGVAHAHVNRVAVRCCAYVAARARSKRERERE